MKTLIVAFLLSGLFILNGNAQSNLSFRLENNAPFAMVLDGINYPVMSNVQRVQNLPAGRHNMEIYAMVSGYRGMSRRTLYQGIVDLPPYTEQYAVLSPYRGLYIDQQYALQRPGSDPYSGVPYPGDHHHCDDHYGYDNSAYDNTPYQGYDTYNYRGWRNRVDVRVNPSPANCGGGMDYRPGGNFIRPMNSADFAQLKAAVANQSFENSRLSVLRQAMASNYLSVSQITELLGLFWFESSKLSIAKEAYDHCYDKQNYYLVNNAFSFSSSVNDLNQYLASRR